MTYAIPFGSRVTIISFSGFDWPMDGRFSFAEKRSKEFRFFFLFSFFVIFDFGSGAAAVSFCQGF